MLNAPSSGVTLDVLEGLARESGEIALRHFGRVRSERKADETMVTAADREIERFLRGRIGERYPEHAIQGEEYGRSDHETRGVLWSLDPIDGTVSFAAGLPIWAISIGVLEDDLPAAGALFLPLLDEMFLAARGQGAWWNGAALKMPTSAEIEVDDFICVPSHAHRRYEIMFPGHTRSLGSTAAHMAYCARGAAWGALLGRPHLWDIAAAATLVLEAGGVVQHLDGTLVDWAYLAEGHPAPRQLVVGTEPRVRRLQDAITLSGPA